MGLFHHRFMMEKSATVVHRGIKFKFSISVYKHYLFYLALYVCKVM